VRDDAVGIAWFKEAGPVPTDALAQENARLAVLLDRPLEWSARTASPA
jgi:hypothetical protein